MIAGVIRTGLFLGMLACLMCLYADRYGGPLLPLSQWLEASLPFQSWSDFEYSLQFSFDEQ